MNMRYTFVIYWLVGAFISLLLVLACESSSPPTAGDGGDTDTNDDPNDLVSITFTPDAWNLNIEDGVPDHSTFSKNRDRLIAHDVSTQFFITVRQLAERADLLSNEHFTVDGTLIEA